LFSWLFIVSHFCTPNTMGQNYASVSRLDAVVSLNMTHWYIYRMAHFTHSLLVGFQVNLC
jgi:hypothetical protein